ncbi:glycosyltransferase involved in cell wall biosynthesis [Variovorax ginsengisoli]|uniref:Glycosyltransferase involved in cell wall biosynthesis n=1 Tax=Variovorax ginsengisoli TaxID=363844 RepID=A0ABT9SEL6_9BURK|nr:glycosyltransferase involved in cell wall biosynthesis [Variovorax ginsengisoli]
MPLLTIAIPTYNRNAIVRENVEIILSQAKAWIRILILDNCSRTPVAETLEGLVDSTAVDVDIHRNPVNVGANANILKCIELCKTPYLWVIGDDDFLAPGVLDVAYEFIRNEDAIWVNFCSKDIHQPERLNSVVSGDLRSFLDSLSSINELVFISNNIYRTDCIQAGLQLGCLYQSTMAPHVVSMIDGVSRVDFSGKFHLRNEVVFRSISNNADEETSWPLYQAFIGINSLYQLPFRNGLRRDVLRLVRGARHGWLCNRHMFSGMTGLSSAVGKKNAFLTVTGLFASLLVVDGIGVVVSWPVIAVAILAGKRITAVFDSIRKK